MSSIKNTNQKVSKKYDKNFEEIFGEIKKDVTGTYEVDKKTGKLFLVDRNIPRIVKDKMERRTEQIRDMKPITIKPKKVKKK